MLVSGKVYDISCDSRLRRIFVRCMNVFVSYRYVISTNSSELAVEDFTVMHKRMTICTFSVKISFVCISPFVRHAFVPEGKEFS